MIENWQMSSAILKLGEWKSDLEAATRGVL